MLESAGEIHIEFTGDDLTQLSNEAGCHKVQRVPPTERNGRVHTSAVTVVVLDPNKHVPKETCISSADLRVEWYSGTGCGGQNRNKVQTSCRLTHIPTGLTQTAQTRSREHSYQQALKSLQELIDRNNLHVFSQAISARRKSQMGNGINSNLVRTYCFQHGIVRSASGSTITIRQLEKGLIDSLWQ